MLILNSKLPEVRDLILSKIAEGPIQVASHGDADGIFSAAMLSHVAKIDKIAFPETFGDWSQPPGVNFILDMVPLQLPTAQVAGGGQVVRDYTGMCIDHHPQHPEKPTYILYNDEKPTCLMMYQLLGSKLPKELTWKVAGGLVGEGQPELIPGEIWDWHPVLFEEQTKQYESYGDIKVYPLPVWNSLSVNVNSMSRIGQAYQAYEIAKAATSPWDILRHPAAMKARDMVKAEESRIIKERPGIDLGKVFVLPIESDYKLESLLATRLNQVLKGKTVLVINGKSKRMSARGVLALWLGDRLERQGITIKGHPGYCGGELKGDQTYETVLNAIRKVI